MIRDLRDSRTNRRSFLRGVATAGGLAAVAGAVGTAGATPPVQPEPKVKPRSGYRVTAHVSKYYEKARF
jgi:hypothetical protein